MKWICTEWMIRDGTIQLRTVTYMAFSYCYTEQGVLGNTNEQYKFTWWKNKVKLQVAECDAAHCTVYNRLLVACISVL